MVDWDQVERLRAKGLDWDRIADDPRVNFHADASVEDAGRALRALYYQRRSRQRRRPTATRQEQVRETEAKESKWSIARVGILGTPLFGIWFVLAFAFPSPTGVYLSAIPVLGILLAVFGFLLAYGLLRSSKRWTTALRGSLVLGIVLGLVIAGGLSLAAVLAGCGVLPPNSTAEPDGWQKVAATPWKDGGVPVFFFYGSAGCPYCSASSWAMYYALTKFGSVSGQYYDHSSPTDVYPNTPEVVLADASLASPYVSLQVAETTYDGAVTLPGTSSCVQTSYVNAYAGGAIPFVVVGGVYFHAGTTLVSPAPLAGLQGQDVWTTITTNPNNPVSQAILPQANWIIAFILKANGGQPASLATNSTIAPLLGQIS